MPTEKPKLTALFHEAKAVAPVSKDKGGLRTVKVIDAGWGSTGYYDPTMLKETAPKALPAGTHMYIDHPSETEKYDRPERSITAITGVLATPAKWDEAGPDGPGVYAKMSVRPSQEALVEELAPYIGVSISCMMATEWGEDPNGREGPIVKELIPHTFNSVDLVTHAGRGGAIMLGNESAQMKEADAAYLRAAGISVSSTPKPPGAPSTSPPKKGFKMAELTEEGARALATAQEALAAELKLGRESAAASAAAAAAAADKGPSPIQAAIALTQALEASKLPVSFHPKVLADVELGMDPVKAIERWKEIVALIPSANGTESVNQNLQVHGSESGASGVTGATDIGKMFESLGRSYGRSNGFGQAVEVS